MFDMTYELRGTKTGREHLGQPGRLQAVLFETFFTRFDFAAHERVDYGQKVEGISIWHLDRPALTSGEVEPREERLEQHRLQATGLKEMLPAGFGEEHAIFGMAYELRG